MPQTVGQTLTSLATHKPGQGKYVRVTALVFLVAMTFFGCYELYFAAPDAKFTVVYMGCDAGKEEDVVKALIELYPDKGREGARDVVRQPGTVLDEKIGRGDAYVRRDALVGAGAKIDLKQSGLGAVIWETSFLGRRIAVMGMIAVAAPIFIAFSWLFWRLLNLEKSAEFLIETEGELRKVSWPARKEYLGASLVVICLTIGLALFLYAVDFLLSKGLDRLGAGY